MTSDRNDPESNDPLWTTRDAARRLGVSLRTVQLWVEAGILPAGRTAGGHRRIRRSDVEALVAKSGLRAPAAEAPRRYEILLVEDHADLRRLWQTTLEGLGDSVALRSADNGYSALLMLGRLRPDLLITDLMMPGMDGFEMLKSLDRARELQGMKVLVITALSAADIAERGGLPDRVSVLHKPVAPSTLLEKVEQAISDSGVQPL